MSRNWLLSILAAFLLVLFSLLTFHLHYEGIDEVLSQFEKHQLSYAKHLSNQIEFYIQARTRGLRALSSLASLQYGNVKQQGLDIQAYAKQIDRVYVKAISLHNASGTVAYSTDPNTIGVKRSESDFFLWSQRSENQGKILLAPISPGPESLTFILAAPLYQDVTDPKPTQPAGTFAGVLTFTLDMKRFLASQLGSMDPQLSLDQVWIVDNDGTLLFQPDHPEMIFRNIYQREGSCSQCHVSFNYVEEILRKRQGTVDYKIISYPKKIAAYAPMEFESVSWVVVVNTPYDEVTGFVKKSLRDHLFLLGIVVLGFAIGSALIIRNERMKIKAEEELTRWQEKMAERKKAEDILQLERNKLKGILDSIKDGVYIVNPQNEIQYINPVIEKRFGPIKGRKCHEYFNEFPTPCSWCKNKEVFAGKTVQWEWHFSRTGKTYELIDTPLLDQDETLCKLEIFHDITERKRAADALRESEKQLRDLSSQLMTAQETERKRISRELHDELGQALTAMKLRLNFIEKNLSLKDLATLKQECRYGIDYIDQVIEDVRRLSRDLSPSILEDFGLYAAIRWLVNNFVKNYNIKVNLEMIDIDILIPRYDHVLVYRIVQETLTNIGKHSQARNASVTSSTDGITVLISIEDDGIGFDPNKVVSGEPGEKGLGLATMKGRAGMLGGVLGVRSQEGRGTRISLTIPIKRGGSL